MTDSKKIILSLTAFFTAICIGVYIYTYTDKWMYYRLHYHKDRISISLFATIDGEPVAADDIKVFVCETDLENGDILYENQNVLKLRDNGKSAGFSIKADSYGDYHFLVAIGDYEFVLEAYQWNWWDVQSSDLYIDIDTENMQYKTHETYSYISEQMGYIKVTESVPETINTLYDRNELWVGNK